MTQHALYVQLEAKPGKEQEVASFLSGARTMVNDEPDTTAWFAIRMGPRMFGIFDAFADERGREAHLQGKLAKQITSKGRICSSRRRRCSALRSSRTSCLTSSERQRAPTGARSAVSAAGVSAALPFPEGQKPHPNRRNFIGTSRRPC